MPQRIQQWQTMGYPEHPIPLLSPESCQQILLQVPGLYKDNPNSFDPSQLNFGMGFYHVQPVYDPLSDFWGGSPVWYDSTSWPTKQHAMAMACLRLTSTETPEVIKNTLTKFTENDPFKAYYYQIVSSRPAYQTE